jgi:hypothetical protein
VLRLLLIYKKKTAPWTSIIVTHDIKTFNFKSLGYTFKYFFLLI